MSILRAHHIFGAACLSWTLLAGAAHAEWMGDPLGTESGIQSKPVVTCNAPLDEKTDLTLSEAVRIALCHNPATRESWMRVLANAAQLGTAKAAYLPGVTGTGSIQRNLVDGNNSTGADAVLSLDYLLFDFGARAANKEVMRQALLSADYAHQNVLQTILFQVVESYYRLFSARASKAAAAETLKSTRASWDAAKLRREVGVATIADELQAETLAAQADLRLEAAKNQEHIAQGVLANMMGLSPDAPFTLPDSAPEALASEFTDSIGQMLEESKKKRPDLAASAAQLEAARANVSLRRASGLPTFSLSGSQQEANALSGPSGGRDGTFLGATVRIPLFTGFGDHYQTRAAEAEAEAQEAQFKETENMALLEVWTAYNNFNTAKENYQMTATLLASAQKSQEVALGRYKAGAGTITELLNAEAQLADSRQQRVSAEYGWMIAKADLLRAMGKLDATLVTEGTP